VAAYRRTARLTFAVTGAAVALGLVATPAADTPHVTSLWRAPSLQVEIDGTNGEWARLDELPSGPAIAAVNDDQVLDVIVSTTDQGIRRELASGVIVWFDPEGDKKQTTRISGSRPNITPVLRRCPARSWR
jgi:hypothetical protein